MPILHLTQPFQSWLGTTNQDPDYWEVGMYKVGVDGFPTSMINVPLLNTSIYFDCNEATTTSLCQKWLTEYQKEMIENIPQSEVDMCVSDNISRCVELMTDTLPYENGWLLVRACNINGCSDWSNAKTVPENGFSLMIGISLLFILIANKFKNKNPPAPKRRGVHLVYETILNVFSQLLEIIKRVVVIIK